MTGGVYRAEIDGLRFLAIATVVVGHFGERAVRFFPRVDAEARGNPLLSLLQHPGHGVFLFFAISGFILATQAMNAKNGPLSGKFLRAYFERRVLRIEPPYFIVLVATWALLTFSGYVPDGSPQFEKGPKSLTVSLSASVFYMHDFLFGAFPRLFPPGWSLEAEVQFYLLAPLLFWTSFKIGGPLTRALFGTTLLLIGTFWSLFTPTQLGPLFLHYSIMRYFHFFWLGIVLADMQNWIVMKTQHASTATVDILGWGAFLCFLAVPAVPEYPVTPHDLTFAFIARVVSLATIAVMFVCVFAPRSSFRSFCANPWVSLIGGACYSIYLTHLQVLQTLTSMIAKRAPDSALPAVALYGAIEIAAVVVIGLVFYALIERTFMIANWPRLVLNRMGKSRQVCA